MRYRVTIEEVASYEVIVEAENEEQAGELAEEQFVNATDITQFPCEVHAREIGNVERED